MYERIAVDKGGATSQLVEALAYNGFAELAASPMRTFCWMLPGPLPRSYLIATAVQTASPFWPTVESQCG
jgi:hypothetical protein